MTVQTVTLTEFLLARIAEDEAAANATSVALAGKASSQVPHVIRWSPARVLAECEAKRRIVAEHPDYGGYGESCATCAETEIDLKPWPCPTLRALALPHADHPDFREEWRP